MSDTELQFRTSTFGGFQKQDVLNYIETSNQEHREKLEAVRRELAETAIEKTRAFFTSMGLPSTLREVGIGEEKLPLMAKKAYGPRFDNTFVPLTEEDILNILKMSL